MSWQCESSCGLLTLSHSYLTVLVLKTNHCTVHSYALETVCLYAVLTLSISTHANCRAPYVTALAVGEGATGVLATAMVLVQLRGKLGSDELIFSVTVYFWLMAAVVLVSLAAFIALLTTTHALAERIHYTGPSAAQRGPMYEKLLNTEPTTHERGVDATGVVGAGDRGGVGAGANMDGSGRIGTPDDDDDDDDDGGASEPNQLSASMARRLMLMLAWLSALQNGVKPAVLPFAVRSAAALEAAQLAGLCVDPLGAFAALWMTPRPGHHTALTIVWTGCMVLLVIAAVVPSESLASRGAGVTCAVSILASFLLAYSKASVLLCVKR